MGCWIMKECLTAGMVMPSTSASWKPSVPSRSVRARLSRDGRRFRELELRPAARAQSVVQGHDLAARGAAPMRLVVLVAVEHGGHEPDEGRDGRDQEPEQERAALDPPDHAAGQA